MGQQAPVGGEPHGLLHTLEALLPSLDIAVLVAAVPLEIRLLPLLGKADSPMGH
jgi:hypothetical protein